MHRQDKSVDTFRANVGRDCGVNWVFGYTGRGVN